jgi:hypothetical protein
MTSRISRIALLAASLAAFVGMSVAAAPASAAFQPTIPGWVVTGSLTPKKLNEPVTLPPGSTFNGTADLELAETISGTMTGTVSVPPFNATLRILGVPTTVGVTFTQVSKALGTVNSTLPADCAGAPEWGCLALSFPTKANVGITALGILGANVPTHCETSEPITLPLKENLTLLELLGEPGPHFAGVATIPSITCGGLDGLVLGPALTAAMSGPDNAYDISIAPPPPPPPKEK